MCACLKDLSHLTLYWFAQIPHEPIRADMIAIADAMESGVFNPIDRPWQLTNFFRYDIAYRIPVESLASRADTSRITLRSSYTTTTMRKNRYVCRVSMYLSICDLCIDLFSLAADQSGGSRESDFRPQVRTRSDRPIVRKTLGRMTKRVSEC
jgi:hypothetical protein